MALEFLAGQAVFRLMDWNSETVIWISITQEPLCKHLPNFDAIFEFIETIYCKIQITFSKRMLILR